MINFTKGQLIEFFKSIGLTEKEYLNKGEIVDLFKLLSFKPKINTNGERELTPYEILRVPPKFRDGKEVPIVFIIKNRTRAIGKYKGQELNFYYKPNTVKNEKTIIETLKSKYRQAIFSGDDEMAKNYLSMIEGLSKTEARDLIDRFYDYSKFYKRMKRQLIIDLFAHFFLAYIMNNLTKIKKGLVKLDRVYRPYRQYESENEPVEFVPNDFEMSYVPDIAANPEAFGIGNIEKVTIKNEGASPITVDFSGDTATIESGKFDVPSGEVDVNNSSPQKAVTTSAVTQDILNNDNFQKFDNSKQSAKTKHSKEDLFGIFGKESKSIIKKKKHLLPKFFGLDEFEDYAEEENTAEQSEQKKPQNLGSNMLDNEEKYEL